MKRLRRSLCLLSFGSFLWGQGAPAEAPVPKPARPLFTTSAGVTAPGVLELEMGVQKHYHQDRSDDLAMPAQLNLGINRWFDLRLGWSGAILHHADDGAATRGGGDPMIGGQVQFATQAKAGLDLGLAHWHKLPRASVVKGLGSGQHDDTLLLTASGLWGRWALDGNAGANWIGRCEGEGRVRQGAASLAITCALAPGWSITLDTYAVAATELGPQALSNVLAVTRELSPALCVDLGLEVGHSDGAPRYALYAGLVWRLGRLWQPK